MKGWKLGLLTLALIACKDNEPVDDTGPSGDDTGIEGPVDADGDGYDADEDCDDDDDTIHPDADEVCDGVDNDCDEAVDDADDDLSGAAAWYTDADGDGFGDPATEQLACEAPEGMISEAGDCDDADGQLHPDADEVCDGVDNDCDGAVDDEDDDLTGAPSWYDDQDQDGYGDPGTEQLACTAPSGVVDNGLDCDDDDMFVNPDASEVCDGVDNDCDPGTSEAGWVRYLTDEGYDAEYNAEFNNGTVSNPYVFSTNDAGTLFICEGSYYARIEARTDMRILGMSGSGLTTLDASGSGSGLLITTGGLNVEVSGLTFTGGVGTGAYLSQTLGGGVRCDASSDLSLDDVVITGSTAGLGAGLFSRGCSVQLNDSRIEGNTSSFFGGGAAIVSGSATFEGSDIADNLAPYGGGLLAGAVGSATVDLIDSRVIGNTTTGYGGGVLLDTATLTCSGSASVDAGIYGNDAPVGGGVYITSSSASFTATSCDFGSGADDNDPDDMANGDWSEDGYGDDASFSCTFDGCN
ncbi:MAG: putative metal-binding motif-containing protein [Alphaproteobacteria bacterium]|nr:putative metal-binding motif-containing protein [Alphaproteobacteria bacterium]